MLALFKPKPKHLLGIDIGSSSVKVLEISGDASHYMVHGYGTEIIPEKAIEGNTIKDAEAVGAAIRRVVSRGRYPTKFAALAVPDSSVISKIVQINEGLSDLEMEELVIVEADKYIPYPIDEINIDFEVLGPSAKNAAMLDVLIVASRAENVSSRLEVAALAGLEARIMDVESYAVERSVALMANELPAQGQDKIIAVLDIGAVYTHLFVLHGMKIIFSREEEFGSRMLIETSADHYEMSIEQAIAMHEEGQFPEDYKETVLLPFQDMIFTQIKRTLQFFYSTSQHSFVDHILLAGRVARQEGLAQMLQEQLGVMTTVVNPFTQMSLAPNVDQEKLYQDAPGLLVACGLALRELD